MKIKMLTTSVIGRNFYTCNNEYEVGKDISDILADKLIAVKYAIKLDSDDSVNKNLKSKPEEIKSEETKPEEVKPKRNTRSKKVKDKIEN